MKRPIPLKIIISASNSRLSRLTGNVHKIKQLNKRLGRLLPANASQHCRVSNIHEQALVVHCDSSAWATRIRLEQSKIIKAFRDLGTTSITIQVQHQAKPAEQSTQAPPRNLSPKSANLLNQLAEGTTDKKLRSALQRLAQRSGQTSR